MSLLATQLLSAEELEELVTQSVSASSELLQNVGLTLLTDQQSQGGTEFEQNLVTILLEELGKLVRPLSGEARELLNYWSHRIELSNLKAIIRGKMTNQAAATIRDQLVDMGPFTTLPVDDLILSDNAAELLRRLEHTPYVDIARHARVVLEERRELFWLDAALDRRYFAGLAKRANGIEPGNGYTLRMLVGSVIDRVNLVWLLRYRFAYNLPPAQAYYLLIPAGQRLTSKQLLALSQCGDHDELINKSPPPFAEMLQGAATTSEVTLRLERETWRIAEYILKRSVFNIARALAYMILRERDLRRIRAIARGERLHMETGLIRAATGL